MTLSVQAFLSPAEDDHADRPVFVDHSGRRARWAYRCLTVVAAVAAAFLVIVAVSVLLAVRPSGCYSSTVMAASGSPITMGSPAADSTPIADSTSVAPGSCGS